MAEGPSDFLRAVRQLDLPQVNHYLDQMYDPNTILVDGAPVIYSIRLLPSDSEEKIKRKFNLVHALLEAGADPNHYSERGTLLDLHPRDALTPLIKQYNGRASQKRAMGAEYDPQNKLFDYALVGNQAGLLQLLGARVDLNARDISGNTVLHVVAGRSDEAHLLPLLIEAGSHLNAQNKDQETALMVATDAGFTNHVALLLAAGADMNLPNDMGDTPLMVAVMNGDNDIIDLLLEAGANPNLQNSEGETALHLAVEANGGIDRALVSNLLLAGANPTQKDYSSPSMSPLDIVENEGPPEIVRLLRAKIDKRSLDPVANLYQEIMKNNLGVDGPLAPQRNRDQMNSVCQGNQVVNRDRLLQVAVLFGLDSVEISTLSSVEICRRLAEILSHVQA